MPVSFTFDRNQRQEILMGVLPCQTIREMCRVGYIAGIDDSYINPGSLDLPASDEAYRLEKPFMPRDNERVRDRLAQAGASLHDMRTPLEVGVSYLIRLSVDMHLPNGVYGYANPKSSSGRLGMLVRTLADRESMYDAVSDGWQGEVWMLVQSRSFPLLLSPGIALVQVRFFDGKAFLDQVHMSIAIQEHGIFFDRAGCVLPPSTMRSHPDSLFLSIRADVGQVGWVTTGSSKVLDLSKQRFYQPQEFSFEPVIAHGGEIILLPGSFYILTTDEAVKVPPSCSAELRAMDPRLGEFRSHAAGFIDAGWGYSKDLSKKGQPITLEITTSEVGKLSLCHGQRVARIRFERMSEAPEVVYDDAKSNYTNQTTAKLSKHFVDH